MSRNNSLRDCNNPITPSLGLDGDEGVDWRGVDFEESEQGSVSVGDDLFGVEQTEGGVLIKLF